MSAPESFNAVSNGSCCHQCSRTCKAVLWSTRPRHKTQLTILPWCSLSTKAVTTTSVMPRPSIWYRLGRSKSANYLLSQLEWVRTSAPTLMLIRLRMRIMKSVIISCDSHFLWHTSAVCNKCPLHVNQGKPVCNQKYGANQHQQFYNDIMASVHINLNSHFFWSLSRGNWRTSAVCVVSVHCSCKAVVPCENKIILKNFSVARNHV